MDELHVFQLAFTDTVRLERAFEVLLEATDVHSCMVEPGTDTARFLATARTGDALLARIYGDGGLRWCSRHRIAYPMANAARPRRREVRHGAVHV